MSRGERDKLSERELHELYEFVESGYRSTRHRGPMRRLAGATARSMGFGRTVDANSDRTEVKQFDSPLDAVFERERHQFTIPASWLRNHILFGHGSGAFNAWEATVRQLAVDRRLDHRDTALARFYQVFQPATFAELMFADPHRDVPRSSRLWQVKTQEYRDVYPWSPTLEKWPAHVPAHLRLTEYGPVGDEIVQLEVWRLRRLVESISRVGFQPGPASFTRGYLLKVDRGARFIVRSGFHRATTLVGLNHTEVPVMLSRVGTRLVTLDSIEHWPMVRNGLFTPELAEKLARNMVNDAGAEFAKSLGFEPHP